MADTQFDDVVVKELVVQAVLLSAGGFRRKHTPKHRFSISSILMILKLFCV